MRFRCDLRLAVGLCVPLWLLSGTPVSANDEPGQDPGVFDRIGNTAKKVGKKIEQGVSKAARKIEEKKVGEKIERKLNKAVTKTKEGFKKAGDKIDKKLE